METIQSSDKYPIGEFIFLPDEASTSISRHIETIAAFPVILRNEAGNLNEKLLETPYREGGWTVRQVVHHLADSHMNAYCRFKLAVTETKPVIKPYKQELWANTSDSKKLPVEISLNLIEALHKRWAEFLRSLNVEDFNNTYIHPEYNKEFSLLEALANYAWHCNHHLAHIRLVTKSTE